MFIIERSDGRHFLVANSCVLYDEKTVKKGDEVKFLSSGKNNDGVVVEHSGKISMYFILFYFKFIIALEFYY